MILRKYFRIRKDCFYILDMSPVSNHGNIFISIYGKCSYHIRFTFLMT